MAFRLSFRMRWLDPGSFLVFLFQSAAENADYVRYSSVVSDYLRDPSPSPLPELNCRCDPCDARRFLDYDGEIAQPSLSVEKGQGCFKDDAATRFCAPGTIGHSSMNQQHLQRKDALERSKSLGGWVADRLNGLTIRDLPLNRRLQLAMAFQHLAIEHSHAIVALIDHGWYGSALALQRSLFESLVRGVWLRYVASDHEVDMAAKGRFPTLERMTRESPESMSQSDPPPLQVLKQRWWKRLCGYTHGGPEQILARLDHTGIRATYLDEEVLAALHWSDVVQLFAGIQMADAADNAPLVQAFMARDSGL